MINRHFKFTNYPASVVAVVTVCGFASCATYSKVSQRRPRFIPFATGTGPLANAQTAIVKAMRIDRRDPVVALGEYISPAETALRQLKHSPNDQTARNAYNFAVGRIMPRFATQSSIRGRNRCECRETMESSCLRTSPTRADNGIQRSTILRRRISSTSVGLTSPNARLVMASARQLSRLGAK
jgi:hypothetical protein